MTTDKEKLSIQTEFKKEKVIDTIIRNSILPSEKNQEPDKNELIMYIIINKDLKMSTGKTAAQASHSVTSYLINTMTSDNLFEKNRLFEWYSNCQKKIVLGAHQKVMEKLEQNNEFFAIHDNGLTEIPSGSLTAICLGLHTKEEVKDITKRLQLL